MELRVEDLRKSYGGAAVLQGVSFTAEIGLTRVTGSSGIGKTTLLRILLGLESPDGGATNADCFRWAAVFQEDRLLEQLDAAGNLRFALGAAYDEAASRALLAELGLGDAGGKRVRDWSGGMKRRLALARALLAPSDALALDEPSPDSTRTTAPRRSAASRGPHGRRSSCSSRTRTMPSPAQRSACNDRKGETLSDGKRLPFFIMLHASCAARNFSYCD